MRKALLVLGVAASLAIPAACDLQKTGNQLTARKVMVATLLSTPPVDISPAAVAGLDGSFPWDGGFPSDAGWDGGWPDASFPNDSGFTFDGGVITVPAQTAAFVFFGERTGDSLEAVPSGVAGATVQLAVAGGSVVALKPESAGSYVATSNDDPSLKYEAGKTYRFTAAAGGESFIARVDQSPALERISAFHPPKGFVEVGAGTSFSFIRPDPPSGQERLLGFVTVIPVSSSGDRGEPSYTNVPKTPVEFLKLVALPAEWKKTQVTIPGTAFPERDKNYLIVFQTVKTGGPESDNLFAGSAILVGTADVAVVKTR